MSLSPRCLGYWVIWGCCAVAARDTLAPQATAAARAARAKSARATALRGKVDFDGQIRPILSENCYKCHGPDANERKAKLRFDVREDALKPAKSGERAIVPSAPEKSQMVARITATDLD